MPQPETKASKTYRLQIFADYHQFYLLDEHTRFVPPDDWEEQLVTQLLAIAPGILGIGTVRNMTVPVSLAFLPERPSNDTTGWNHIVEASLDVPSGKIVIMGSSDFQADALHLPTKSDCYRVRVHYRGLASISESGLTGDDHYHLLLWPEASSEPLILKRWTALV